MKKWNRKKMIHYRKKIGTVLLAGCLGAALTAGSCSVPAYALESASSGDGEAETASKDETVYVLADAEGSVRKIIVSDWLQNEKGSQILRDRTDLQDVENVEGEETYTLEEDGTLLWNAQGKDIYYQGTADKELPVELSVSYELDGVPVSPTELAGKSGRVKIRFDYANHQYETVEINGKQEKIYVPFIMLTGLILDNNVFSNVEVSNGKLINDGDRTIVLGLAFPGLQEDLGLQKEKLSSQGSDFQEAAGAQETDDLAKDQINFPDYVEIACDAKDFSLGMTVTLAANEFFSDLAEEEKKDSDPLGTLSGSMEELTDAMGQLLDGSSKLYDGLSELLESSGELSDGVDELAAGAKVLNDGTKELDAGAASLQAGAAQLRDGLNTLASNNGALNGGARQVFETLLSTAAAQLSSAGLAVPALTIENYGDVLNGVIASLDESAVYETALATVTAAVEAKRPEIEGLVTAAVREEVTQQVTSAVQEQVTQQVTAAVREQVAEQVIQSVLHMDKAAYEALIAGSGEISGGDAPGISEEVQTMIEGAIEQQMQSEQVAGMIEAKIQEQMGTPDVLALIDDNVETQMHSEALQETIASTTEQQVRNAISENMASAEVQSQLAAASEGAKSVISLKASLDSYQTFYQGLLTYTAGVSSAAQGAGELKAGTDTLKNGTGELSAGAAQLSDGILALQSNVPALIDGVTQLRDGSMQLSDGLKEFNEQGIQKLTEAVNGDLESLMDRIQAMEEVSEHYKFFAGGAEDMEGQVKFLFRTEEIQ